MLPSRLLRVRKNERSPIFVSKHCFKLFSYTINYKSIIK